ncbi:MAG TPA: hypothetical protein VLZ89_01880 [Anaerolineales bacterium]|nr:hypothetical protein [Anaerolineales bacterium]
MQADGVIKELVLLDGRTGAWIQCDASLIPSPGQYLLAYAPGSDAPLAAPVFLAGAGADGFLAAPPLPVSWTPGVRLHLRGPLGRGFTLPRRARRVALLALDDAPTRILALLDGALKQEASVVLVCEAPGDDLPLQVEVQPLSALLEVCNWADYLGLEARRESLGVLKTRLGRIGPQIVRNEAQILIAAPMPCGALADCGVCTVASRRGPRLACKDGPVFDLKDLLDG